uniref:SCP domain-containing protein n=1 Tax=Megaselia scalaris TaxID=36166 RepID=T1GA08_MEGSC
MLVAILILFFALYSVNFNSKVAGKEYSFCDPDLCGGRRNTHIACNNYREFARSCPADANILDVSAFKESFVQAHNERRNFVALGLLPGFEPATKMATM